MCLGVCVYKLIKEIALQSQELQKDPNLNIQKKKQKKKTPLHRRETKEYDNQSKARCHKNSKIDR